MVYLLKMVIFHGYVSHSQMVTLNIYTCFLHRIWACDLHAMFSVEAHTVSLFPQLDMCQNWMLYPKKLMLYPKKLMLYPKKLMLYPKKLMLDPKKLMLYTKKLMDTTKKCLRICAPQHLKFWVIPICRWVSHELTTRTVSASASWSDAVGICQGSQALQTSSSLEKQENVSTFIWGWVKTLYPWWTPK